MPILIEVEDSVGVKDEAGNLGTTSGKTDKVEVGVVMAAFMSRKAVEILPLLLKSIPIGGALFDGFELSLKA